MATWRSRPRRRSVTSRRLVQNGTEIADGGDPERRDTDALGAEHANHRPAFPPLDRKVTTRQSCQTATLSPQKTKSDSRADAPASPVARLEEISQRRPNVGYCPQGWSGAVHGCRHWLASAKGALLQFHWRRGPCGRRAEPAVRLMYAGKKDGIVVRSRDGTRARMRLSTSDMRI